MKHLARDQVLSGCSDAVRRANPRLFAVQQEPAAPQQKARYRSKAEALYAELLEAKKRAGEIRDWHYEALTLVIGDDGNRRARYTPDFLVEHLDGIELVEVKGAYCREAAKVRFRCAVAQHSWARWTWAELEGGHWSIRGNA